MKLRTRIKIAWDKLWIREDEFHSSLDMDINSMLDMDDKERDDYLKDLTKRRNIAHKNDIN